MCNTINAAQSTFVIVEKVKLMFKFIENIYKATGGKIKIKRREKSTKQRHKYIK